MEMQQLKMIHLHRENMDISLMFAYKQRFTGFKSSVNQAWAPSNEGSL